MVRKNRFTKALKHLKSTELDEKIQSLKEAPTNKTTGVYSLGATNVDLGPYKPPKIFLPDKDGNFPAGIPGNVGDPYYERPAGYWSGGRDWDNVAKSDYSHAKIVAGGDNTSTAGLISDSGGVQTRLPPNSRHFILGPIVDGYVYNHGYDNYTNIGYLQKDTRQFVLLGRIYGQWKSGVINNTDNVWNGTSFTAYNPEFTLEMAQWIKSEIDGNRFYKDVPYHYSGGVPQQQPNWLDELFDGMFGGLGFGGGGNGGSAADATPGAGGYGSGGQPDIGQQRDPDSEDNHGNDEDAGLPAPGTNPNDDEDEKQKLLDQIAELNKQSKALADYLNREGVNQNQAMAGAIVLVPWAWKAIATAGLSVAALQAIISSYNASDYVYQSTSDKAWEDDFLDGSNLSDEQWEAQAQQGRERDAEAARQANERSEAAQDELAAAQESGNQDRIDRAEEEYRNAERNQERVRSNNTRNRESRSRARRERYGKNQGGIQGGASSQGSMGGGYDAGANYGSLALSYKPQGVILSENKKRLLREIKRPVLIEETPKTKLKGYRPNFKGKFTPQNTPNVTACKKSDELALGANARGQKWREEDKYWKGYETTERMNVIHDRMGHSSMAWDAIIDEARNKNGWKNREIQEQLNRYYALKAERELGYIQEEEDPNQDEIDKYMKDPLVKRVRKRLLTQIDYPDKPSKKGYPDEAPKPQVDGWHPEFGKKSAYYKKLDPVSALAMPTQGDPEIDAEVENQKKKYVKPKVAEDTKENWRDSLTNA